MYTTQSYVFSSSHVQIWELDHKKDWTPKNWCFWTVVLEKTLGSRLDSKEIKADNPKGSQPWISTGRTDAEAGASALRPPDLKSWITGKDTDAGKDWKQEEKGTTENEMVGWHHQLNWHESEQAPRNSEGQVSLVWHSPWGCRESDMTEQWNNNIIHLRKKKLSKLQKIFCTNKTCKMPVANIIFNNEKEWLPNKFRNKDIRSHHSYSRFYQTF